MEWVRTGCTREVFLTRRHAIKVPSFHSWRLFLTGLLCNMQERTFSKAGWPELCPVVWSIPGGWLLVMRRADEMDRETWFSFSDRDGGTPTEAVPAWINKSGDYFIPVEMKMNSFGILDGRIVAIDYGS